MADRDHAWHWTGRVGREVDVVKVVESLVQAPFVTGGDAEDGVSGLRGAGEKRCREGRRGMTLPNSSQDIITRARRRIEWRSRVEDDSGNLTRLRDPAGRLGGPSPSPRW